MALYIFSDAHLGSNDEAKESEKLSKIARFFELVKADGDRLIILGDLFDFWFEYKHTIPKEHHRTIFMLSQLIAKGIQIDYVSGNHDFWMGDFFEKQVGITVHQDSLDMEYENLRIHLIHGDGLAPGDSGYRLLKKILRNRVNIWLYQKRPPDWAIPLAKFVSGSSRKHTSKREDSFAGDYETYAKQKLADNGYDVVAIGHVHQPVIIKYDDGTYVNSGDFIDHFSYVKISSGEIELKFIK